MAVNRTYLLVRVLSAHVHFSSRVMHVGNSLQVSSFINNIMECLGQSWLYDIHIIATIIMFSAEICVLSWVSLIQLRKYTTVIVL